MTMVHPDILNLVITRIINTICSINVYVNVCFVMSMLDTLQFCLYSQNQFSKNYVQQQVLPYSFNNIPGS